MIKPANLWLNGQYLSTEDHNIDGLQFSNGAYEDIRAYLTDDGPQLFRLQQHLTRMQRAASLLGLTFDRSQIEGIANTLLQPCELRDAHIRIIAFYGGQGLYFDEDNLTPQLMIAALPPPRARTTTVSLGVSPYRRLSYKSLPPLQLTSSHFNDQVAKREARERGYDEALFIDDDGHVCQTTGENLFFIKGGRIIAVEHPDAKRGITRDAILQMTGALSRPVKFTELLDADEIFLCSTLTEIRAVSQLHNRALTPGTGTAGIQDAYQDLVRGRALKRGRWLTAA